MPSMSRVCVSVYDASCSMIAGTSCIACDDSPIEVAADGSAHEG